MENVKMKEIKEKYRDGHDIHNSAIEQFSTSAFYEHHCVKNSETPLRWTLRYVTRTAVNEMAMWIHNTFDLTDEQVEELNTLMTHVGSD